MKKIMLLLLIPVPVFSVAQNVGIGIITPTEKLEVKNPLRSTLKISSNSTADTTELRLSNKEVNIFGEFYTDFSIKSIRETGLFFSSRSDFPTYNSANSLVIRPQGNVGIGTSLPAYRFQVNENVAASGYMSITNTTTGSNATDGLLVGLAGNNAVVKNFENGSLVFGTNNTDVLGILPANNGTVIIGDGPGTLVAANGYKLNVHGGIVCTEVMVKNVTNWPDYVFLHNYKLMPLTALKKFIQQNKHLPNIESAAVIEKKGVTVGEMQKKLLEKIEELTLYILQQHDKINRLSAEMEAVKKTLRK